MTQFHRNCDCVPHSCPHNCVIILSECLNSPVLYLCYCIWDYCIGNPYFGNPQRKVIASDSVVGTTIKLHSTEK